MIHCFNKGGAITNDGMVNDELHPREDGGGLSLCIRKALQDAGVDPD